MLRTNGDFITDVFEANGERHFFAGNTPSPDGSRLGGKSSEPISDFITRKGIKTPPPTSAPSVATANATKVTPLAGEYDTGATAAKVASGQPIVTPPPVTSTSVPPVSVPPTTKPPISRGPTVGAPTSVRTTPGPHGAVAAPVASHAAPVVPVTSPTGPTARILTATRAENITAREAIRGIAEDIKAVRKPGQRLLSANGSKAMAEAVTQGIKGSRNLKMLAVGSALGLGGYTANRLAGRGDTSDLGG